MSSLFKLPSLADVMTNEPNTTPKQPPQSLLTLPPELLVLIFQSASSLADAAYLAACSKKLHNVWLRHLTAIYNHVAPASIPAHDALVSLLTDLNSICPNGPITLARISNIVKGSKIGTELVETYLAAEDANKMQDPQVSLTLSPAEERRFVRSMYQILGLFTLDKKAREKRIVKLDLKTQFLLADFICVFRPHEITDPAVLAVLRRDSGASRSTQRHIRARRNKVFLQLYETDYHPGSCTPWEDGGRFAWWTDRQQGTLREMLTGRVFRGADGKPDMAKVQDDEWYDSAEE